MTFNYRRFEFNRATLVQDPRDHFTQFKDKLRNPHTAATTFALSALAIAAHPWFMYIADLLLIYNSLYFLWFLNYSKKFQLTFKMPKSANRIDPNNKSAGGGKPKPAEGILYLGNDERTGEEVWFSNTDARTHILYLGTTGSGKTEGLKSMVSNALGWGSGFIYVDGKADTDLWGSVSALARRFGRDDDLLVLNYMTGNSDNRVVSNTVNPFAQGSASYLTNLLVSLMPEVQGDNAMWKDRAVALISALMPVLTWQRNYQEKNLNIGVIREALNFKKIIELSRRPEIPERLRKGLKGYLDTLPGYVDSAFNDDGTEKPNPNGPPTDYATIYQQHGYLSMQFTRQLQSLADDYGYIFESPSADIDMMDVVLNRRIVVVLIPALEKSADETANLGKIVGSMLKGMMGATLGASVEGDTELALENKPTRSSTPFMAVFDEVGYYTTQGMAVMAAQARSLGFSLIFAGQDLPALEKRIKEEARSITANCNIKIFGKLEDPTQTKEFFEKSVGEASVVESTSRKETNALFGSKKLSSTDSFNVGTRAKAFYSQLKSFTEGQAIVSFSDKVIQAKMFYSNPGKIRSLRVNRFLSIPHPDPDQKRASKDVDAILERVRDRNWVAAKSNSVNAAADKLKDIMSDLSSAQKKKRPLVEAASFALTQFALKQDLIKPDEKPAMPAVEEKPVAEETKPLVAERADAPAAVNAPRDTKSAPSTEEEAAAKGTEETISWSALLADEPATKQSAPSASKAPPAPEVAPESLPNIEETISWKDLMAQEAGGDASAPASTQTVQASPAQISAPPLPPPPPASPAVPASSFGLGGFGTGFGGIGGFGSSGIGTGAPIGFAGTQPNLGTPTAPKSDQKQNDEKVKKALDEGETVSWKDLIE